MSTMTSTATAAPMGWIRNPTFDLALIAGTTAVALTVGAFVAGRPDVFRVFLVLDLWLLGYHHVGATLTRLAMDGQSWREHRTLVTRLPILVIAATVATGLVAGIGVLTAVYFYWQAFHYARQSWGVARIYRRKLGEASAFDARLDVVALTAVPLAGALWRSAQGQPTLLGMPVTLLPVPDVLARVAIVVAGVLAVAWIGRQVVCARRDAYTLFVASHLVVFTVGYVLMPDLSQGWIVLNVWHNVQYLMIVWSFNQGRFKAGPSADAPFLSRISQPDAVGRYLLVGLGIGTAIYALILLAGRLPATVLPWAIVLSQSLNFHHYIVDGRIWKVRQAAVRANFGIQH